MADEAREEAPVETPAGLPPGTRVVTAPGAAALLDDPARRESLHPFLDRPCTLAGAARELGVPLTTMHARVGKLLEAGLIEVVEVRARAGRPVRVYRSVAPAFFVPFAATPSESPETQLLNEEVERQRRLGVLLARTLRHAPPGRGLLLRRDPGGTVRSSAHPAPEPGGVAFSAWLERPLSAAHARALHAELRALVERYGALPVDDGDAVVVLRVALAPGDASPD